MIHYIWISNFKLQILGKVKPMYLYHTEKMLLSAVVISVQESCDTVYAILEEHMNLKSDISTST
jgi:hypothetical protein